MTLTSARVGFAMAAAGFATYMIQRRSLDWILLDILTIVGLAVAALEPRRGRVLPVGLAIASVGQLFGVALSLRFGFSLWTIPAIVTAVGVLMCLVAAGRGGHGFGVRAGAWTAAFASSLWILLDPFNAVGVWLPGNLLSIAGFGLVAATFAEETVPPSPAEAPA